MNTLIITEAELIIKGDATVQLRISAVLLRKPGRWDAPYACGKVQKKLLMEYMHAARQKAHIRQHFQICRLRNVNGNQMQTGVIDDMISKDKSHMRITKMEFSF